MVVSNLYEIPNAEKDVKSCRINRLYETNPPKDSDGFLIKLERELVIHLDRLEVMFNVIYTRPMCFSVLLFFHKMTSLFQKVGAALHCQTWTLRAIKVFTLSLTLHDPHPAFVTNSFLTIKGRSLLHSIKFCQILRNCC